jgi:hypothetical protein
MRLLNQLLFRLGDSLEVVLIAGGIAVVFFWAALIFFG